MIQRPESRLETALILLGLFLLALAPRALATGEFVTVDEAVHWFGRAREFLHALQAGNPAGTALTGHPGVTTMWLGALGELAARQLGQDDGLERIRLMRLPVAIVNALCIALAYPALRRLLDARVALLAGLFCATDPFLIAHTRILHVDGLLTSFSTLAILWALLAFRYDQEDPDTGVHWGMLIASGAAGGLALLTKSTALALGPGLAVLALVSPLWRGSGWRAALQRASIPSITAGLIWGLTATLLWVAFWPAAWVAPFAAAERVVVEAIGNGGVPHQLGNFFLGRSVADPGPLFYPVALAFRLTPWALIGLVAACLALILRAGSPAQRRMVLFLLGYSLLFIGALTLLAKKFDRYALPIIPLLQICAAWGLIRSAVLLRRLIARTGGTRLWGLGRHASGAVWGLAVVVLTATTVAYHPYELAYFNPLLGGGAVAARTVPVGWGEGYDLAARYVMAQPDACVRPIAVWYRALIEQSACSNLTRMSDYEAGGEAGYVILYIDQIQRGYYPEATSRLRSDLPPVYTVRIAGIDYAYVYRVPAPGAQRIDATFGGNIRLWSYEIEAAKVDNASAIHLMLEWQALDTPAADELLFIHVLDERGNRVTQVDVPLGGPRAPSSTWAPAQMVTQSQFVPLPNDLPVERYWIAIGVYDPDTIERLQLQTTTPQQDRPDSGPDALTLGAFQPRREGH